MQRKSNSYANSSVLPGYEAFSLGNRFPTLRRKDNSFVFQGQHVRQPINQCCGFISYKTEVLNHNAMKTSRLASSFDVCDYKLDKRAQLYTSSNSFIKTHIREAQFWQIDYQKIMGRNTVIPKTEISSL